MTFDQTNKLQFEFRPGNHDEALGFGSLRVSFGNSPIWSNEQGQGIAWTWIDLLEQLASSWAFLKYDESTPPDARDTLSLLSTGHVTSQDYFETTPESTDDTYIFVRRHNLATGIEGLYVPTLSLLREGRKMWVASRSATRLLDFAETMHTLFELGETLAAQVASGPQQERSVLALEAWRDREPSFEAILQMRLGSNRSAIEMVPRDQTAASYFEVQNDSTIEDAFESSVLVAARMSEAVPIESQRKILDLLRSRPSLGVSEVLRDISAEAEAVMPDYARRPVEQGQKLAQWLRKKFGVPPDAKADPQYILERLNVRVTQHRFGTDVIDAVGCWGHQHGPEVLVNLDGKHAQSSPGRRATLAHELAHVLVDRSGSLPAAEVLGGNVPEQPEKRANAFAAEFLLPKSVIVARLGSNSRKDDIENLRERFGASREVAGWQITNTAGVYHALGRDEKVLLRKWTAGGWNTREI
jgi:Zn-dependent peptidase ImmA (M78 family)